MCNGTILARESVTSSPIVGIFGKGKCKLIANFSATMVTSLPSLSLCISLSKSDLFHHTIQKEKYRRRKTRRGIGKNSKIGQRNEEKKETKY